ncbi:GREM2 [Cordylochernes scorpioides]|uniref:GREM2 n=1 Tax=Cordylochernes scorpioides TaxID=51811 RepID=A0ABY6K0A5_9ARAC|nr:GREM2 [Cordylochernes scorpioides]
MEKLLMVWVTEKQLQGDTLTQTIICEKARAIYGDLLKQTPQTSIDEASEESFKASRGWFENFKKRSGIHSVVRHDLTAMMPVIEWEGVTNKCTDNEFIFNNIIKYYLYRPYCKVRINRPNQAQNLETEVIHVNKLKHYSEDTKYIFTPHSTNNNSKPKSYFIYHHFPPETFHDDYKNYASTSSNPFNHMNPDIFIDNDEQTLTARYISTPDTTPKIDIQLEPSPTTKIVLPSSPTLNHIPQISPQLSALLINCDNAKLENRSSINKNTDGWLRHTSRAFQIAVSSQVKFDEICPAPSFILMFVSSCSIMLIPAPPLLRVRSEDPSVYAVEGRGLAILIKNLYYEDIAVNITNTLDLEAQGIKVYLNQNKAIHIYNMYHPPNNTFIDDGTMAQFLTDNTIIVGDLNAKHQLWGCSTPNPRGKILSNIFDDNAFMCLNDGNPTHHSYKL